MVPLKYLSNFWRTLEMALINREINVDLNCVILANNLAAQVTLFSITDTNVYVPVVTLTAQDNAKLFEQLKSVFKRTTIWNKYKPKVSTESKINIQIGSKFQIQIGSKIQGVNRHFLLSFENESQRTSYKRCYLLARKIRNYNVMIDGQSFFDQPIRNDLVTYDNI